MSVDVEDFYQRYGPMVLRRCRRILKDEERAVDAMHDTFVRLLRNQDRLDESSPSSLLFRIATNVCLNQLRTWSRHPETPDEELINRIAHIDDAEGRTLASRVLERIFEREKPSTRTIAVLHLLDGMTHEEVAREVGLSVSGVRKRLRNLAGTAETISREGTPNEVR